MAETDIAKFYDVSSNIMGKGAFGVVFEGTSRDTGRKVAIKMINLLNLQPSNIEFIKTEVVTLRCLDHPNIVKLFDYYETPSSCYLCMEIVQGGELFDRITQKQFYSEKDARDLILILVSTVKHCHDRFIVHRDIKAENLLMVSNDDDADVKLVDFGFATQSDGFTMEGMIGSPDYMAPEILAAKEKYGAPVDMWALGVLSYIILVGYPPFYDTAPLRLKTKILRGKYEFHPQFWVNVSEEAKDFIQKLLTVDMRTRITAAEALQHPWIALHGDVLAPRRLDDSIIELRKFNAKRRLKASCNAVLAVSKMSRLLSMNKSESASRLVTFTSSGEESVKIDHFPPTEISPQMSSSESVWANSVYDLTPSHNRGLGVDSDELISSIPDTVKCSRHDTQGPSIPDTIKYSRHDSKGPSVPDTVKCSRHDSKGAPPYEDDGDLNRAMNVRMRQLEDQNSNLRVFLTGLKTSDTTQHT